MAVGELLVQVAVLHRDRVRGTDQCFDVGFEVGDLFGVRRSQFPQSPDLLAQPFLVVGVCPRARTLA
jgi:hypothetical protein